MSTGGTERWASRIGLVLAMAGNAVGLGNFLRFPAQAAKNGGGAFLIPYFVALLIVGLPLVWIEWTMGRYGGRFGHHSTPGVFDSMGKKSYWKYFGVFGLWNNLLIAAFYLYIETWCLGYAGFSLIGGFKETAPGDFFARLTGESDHSIYAVSGLGLGLFLACIGLNVYILSRGLAKGIEIVSKIGMPILIVFAAVLAVRGLMISPETDVKAVASPLVGLNFVWEPKFDSLGNPSVWLAAAGQIFFTLSIGMGSMHCYASYLREKDDVTLNGATGAWTNEFCEVILGGTILIPIAVAYLGLEVVQQKVAGGSGFGLGFFVFPTLFNNWGSFAPVAGFMWFGLLFFAAITSSLAMGQPVLAFLQDEFGLTRPQSALAFAGMLLPLALPVALLHSKTFNDEYDFWAGTFALVVMAVLESVLFCWVFGLRKGWEEMMRGADLKVPRFFYHIMFFLTPTFLILILVAATFEPKAGWKDQLAGMVGKGEPVAWEWSSNSMMGKLLHKDLDSELAKAKADLEAEVARKDQLDQQALQKLEESLAKFPEKEKFYENVKFVRTIDRLVMVASFAGLCALITIAWRKRKPSLSGAST